MIMANKKPKENESSISPAIRIGALLLAGLMAAGGLGTIVYFLF